MFDCIIIGCGVAGMSAAVYLKRSGLKVLIIESNTPGGQLNKTNKIENYMGYTTIDGPSLAYNMYNQIATLKVEFASDEVINIKNNKRNKIVITKKNEYKTKKIIIATGRTPRKLNVLNEDLFLNKGISYCAICDGALYKNKNVTIIGAGNSAFEEGIYLASVAKQVTLIHRNSNLRADEIIVDNFKSKNNTNILLNKKIVSFNGKDTLESITYVDTETKREEVINTSGAFIYIGFGPNNGFLDKLNITDSAGYIKVNKKMETKVKGIYAAGDAIKKDIYQIVTAASEGATAAINIKKSIG